MAIDAKNKRVADWYVLHGAIPLVDDPLSLVLPMMTIRMALAKAARNS